MKIYCKKTLLSCLICLSFAAALTAQIKSTKDLPLSYENTQDTILKLGKGDVVHITFDSVYLFNEKRYKDVQMLMSYREFMRNKDPMAKAFSTVWENHSQSLNALEKYIEQLKVNAEQTAKTGVDLANSTIAITKAADNKLDSVNVKLTAAQLKLDAANAELNSAITLIKKDIRWKWLKNAGLVAIGVALGYLAAK
jgi:flagellar biosynthesis chaperone FliJ